MTTVTITTQTDPSRSLVKASVATFLTGESQEKLLAGVESGRWLWVWNLGYRKEKDRLGCLRFWLRELIDRPAARALDQEAVLAQLLPFQHRRRLSAGELCSISDLRRQQIHRIWKAGYLQSEVEDHTLWLNLETVRAFFRQRLIR